MMVSRYAANLPDREHQCIYDKLSASRPLPQSALALVPILETTRDTIVRAMEALMALGFNVAAVHLSPPCWYNTGTHNYLYII